MLGRLTAYVGGIWLALHVVRWAIILFSRSSDALSGWASAFNYIFGIFLVLVLARWIRKAVLWRLRNSRIGVGSTASRL